MAIFFNFSLTSNHFHSLQVENCDSNSRLVVDEDGYGKLRIERVKQLWFPGLYNLSVVRVSTGPCHTYLAMVQPVERLAPATRHYL